MVDRDAVPRARVVGAEDHLARAEALIRQLQGLARQQPVVMVFEDAHWIDPTSRELLDLTVERLRTLSVLLLVTFRPEFQPPWTGLPQVTIDELAAALGVGTPNSHVKAGLRVAVPFLI
jgi:predicted ATPase